MPKYPTERAAAKIAKCPHCNWTGSARGLFSHVRLAHGGKEHLLNIRKENPYLINKAKPKALGNVIRKTPINNEQWLEEFIMKCILKVLETYNNRKNTI
jgi:hypothetical protein